MKSPVQLLTEKRNEMQAEYNRILKVKCIETDSTRVQDSFYWGKRVDLDAIKEHINQYNMAIYMLRNA